LAGGVLGTPELEADIIMRRRFWAYHSGFFVIAVVEATIGDASVSVHNSKSSHSLISIVYCCGVSKVLSSSSFVQVLLLLMIPSLFSGTVQRKRMYDDLMI